MSDDLRRKMTDDLGNRIAAIVSAELCRQQHTIDPYRVWQWFDMQSVAAAVIRELGLRIEYGALDDTDSGRLSDDDDLVLLGGEVLKTRYITDWTQHG